MVISEALKKQLVQYQRNEITEHHIYHKLALRLKGSANAKDLWCCRWGRTKRTH